VTILKGNTQKKLCKFCPYCGSKDLEDAVNYSIIRERKKCLKCGTYFDVQDVTFIVIDEDEDFQGVSR
jgi:hypothetical protein